MLQKYFVNLLSKPVVSPGFPTRGWNLTSKFGAKTYYLTRFFAENCMKMKEIGLGGGFSSLAPLLGSANANDESFKNCVNSYLKHKATKMLRRKLLFSQYFSTLYKRILSYFKDFDSYFRIPVRRSLLDNL